MTQASHQPSLRERARTVADATRIALTNPGDTRQAFRIAQALSFNTPERLIGRMRSTPEGRAILRDKPSLLDTLRDRDKLAALPDGSFGRAYLDFLAYENISADGLVEASEDGLREYYEGNDPEIVYMQQRMRDQHDLWHTLTGYRGDLLGEAALLAFSFSQTKHLGVGFLAGLGMIFARAPGHRHFVVQGLRKGRRARWLPEQRWEELLDKPLDEVRQQLGVKPVGKYEEVREPPTVRLRRWMN